jgi:hypothetical protein
MKSIRNKPLLVLGGLTAVILPATIALAATLSLGPNEVRNPVAKSVYLQSGNGPVSVLWSGKSCSLTPTNRTCTYFNEAVKITNKGTTNATLTVQ